MKKILIIGKDSTIAQHLLRKIKFEHQALSKKDFNVTDHNKIQNFDFTPYNMVINFAGHSRGTYNEPLKNTWDNQLDQIMVNFASHILITKIYCQQNPIGIYMWFSSVSTKSCRPYQYVYAGSKLAAEYSLSAFAKEYKDFKIITKTLDKIMTNHLFNTYEGKRSHQECIEEYKQSPHTDIELVVNDIIKTIDNEI
jgi:short-subunit dehydrogenase